MAHTASLFQLGIDLGRAPRKAQTEVNTPVATASNVTQGPWQFREDAADHFVTRNGRVFAGMHLVIDLWGARHLDQLEHIERALKAAVGAAGATLLHIHLHHFTPNGGVSGVAVLAESHISIHTWPERGYAALDIFMCGDAEPHLAIPVLEAAFQPASIKVDEIYRGEVG